MENRVNELRKAIKKTMREISDETGIGLSTISNYENGYSSPKKENAKILADYFGVSVPYLLGLDDKPTLVDSGSAKEVMKSFYKIITLCFFVSLYSFSKIKSPNGLLLVMN